MIRMCDHTLLSHMICPMAKTEAGHSPILSGMWILHSLQLAPPHRPGETTYACPAAFPNVSFYSSYIIITYYYIYNLCFQV